MTDLSRDNLYLVIDLQYFACVNYINNLFKNTHVEIFASGSYKKMSFRNRCIVAGSNGLVGLSVPLENGRDQKALFKDVRISYRDAWQTQHWRTLTSCYNKSAFFEHYRDGVEQFFLKKEPFLFDLNLQILAWLKTVLKFPAEIQVLDGPVEVDLQENVTDLRDKWLPKNFQDDFSTGGESPTPLKYFQVFESRIGFQPNLSILDLLFNEGPNAATLLRAHLL